MGACDLGDPTEPAQLTLRAGKQRKVVRAKAASEVRYAEVTPELTAQYLASLTVANKRHKRPFFERTVDTPGAAKIFPLPSDRGVGVTQEKTGEVRSVTGEQVILIIPAHAQTYIRTPHNEDVPEVDVMVEVGSDRFVNLKFAVAFGRRALPSDRRAA
jgi:hypothetical protein